MRTFDVNLLWLQDVNAITDHPNVRQRTANVMFELLDVGAERSSLVLFEHSALNSIMGAAGSIRMDKIHTFQK